MHDIARSAPVISSRQHPLVARFREAARGGAGTPLLLDGIHLVLEALTAQLQILDIAISTAQADEPEILELRRRAPDAHLVTPQVLDALSPTRTPAGVVAIAERPSLGTDDMFAAALPLIMVVVDVQDPGNVGAILRTCEAAGASGVVTTSGGADPYGWKAVRGSMGSALRLPTARVADAAAALALVRGRGLRCAAAVRDGGTPMDAADLSGPLAIVLGGEGHGLPAEVIEQCDLTLSIPMAPQVESLNVATAAALLVYEARRQRGR